MQKLQTMFPRPSWKCWKTHVWRTRQLCTSCIKLWTSLTLRILQVSNLQKKR